MKYKWILCKHIPNSGGNPCRFAISLGVKYLSFSVDSFKSFSSSGKFSMCLNTDSSYKEYPRQSTSLCRQNMWNYAVTIISRQRISLIITVPKAIWKFAAMFAVTFLQPISQYLHLQEQNQCCHEAIHHAFLQFTSHANTEGDNQRTRNICQWQNSDLI